MFRLRSYDISPPGGYPFIQEQGIRRVFPSVPVIEDQARNVSSFRTANGLERSSLQDSLKDVDSFTCNRLGNMPSFCVNTDNRAIALGNSSPIVAPGCRGCGLPVK